MQLYCSLFTDYCFAESEFSLRLAPALETPLGLPQFRPGIGAGAALDWAFWAFAKNFKLGVFAGGDFVSLPVRTGDPITFFHGKAGPFIRFRPFDRWIFRAGVGAGVYQFSRENTSYVVVPSLSFVNLHADESALDNLTYPYETLYYRGGDCTYISILFCSLLEVLGIETAFITIPGHLYMAFDVGGNDWMAQNQDIIKIEGKRWLPLEITVPEEGFSRAWRIGAREWKTNGDGAALYPIRECWKVYPPVTVTASTDYPPEMPPSFDIVRAMEAELRK